MRQTSHQLDAHTSEHLKAVVKTDVDDTFSTQTETKQIIADEYEWDPHDLLPMSLPLCHRARARAGGSRSRPDSRASASVPPSTRAATPDSISSIPTFPRDSAAAALLCNGPESLEEDAEILLFAQMPKRFPFRVDKEASLSPVRAAEYLQAIAGLGDVGALAEFSDLPPGGLGELEFHRSGKVVLRIGENLFNVGKGMHCSLHQEIADMPPASNEVLRNGKFSTRIVVEPNLENLLARC